MPSRTLAICYRYFHQIWHRKKLFAFLILLPVLLMTLFGLALYDQRVPRGFDPGRLQSMLDGLRENEALLVVMTILGKGEEGFRTLEAKLLVATIPSLSVQGEEGSVFVVPGEEPILLFLDARQFYYVVFAGDLRVTAWGFGTYPSTVFIPGFDRPTVDMRPLLTQETLRELAKLARDFLEVALDLAAGEEDRLVDLFFPDIVGIEIIWAGVLGAAVMATEDRVTGARRRILMAPVPRSSFLAGTALANFGLVAFQLAILFVIAILVFNVRIVGSPGDVLVLVGIASAAMVGVGLILSHFSHTADEAFYLATLVNVPMMFLSSTNVPLSQNPVTQALTGILPMTHANHALKEITLQGATLANVAPQLWTLAIMAVILYAVGMVLVGRER